MKQKEYIFKTETSLLYAEYKWSSYNIKKKYYSKNKNII